MYAHSCKLAGAEGCGFTAAASTEAELRNTLDAHVKARHGVNGGVTDTIYNYLRETSAR